MGLVQAGGSKKVFRYMWDGSRDYPGESHHGTGNQFYLGSGDCWSKELREVWTDSWSCFIRSGDPNTKLMEGAWAWLPAAPGRHRTLLWHLEDFWRIDADEHVLHQELPRKAAALYEQLWDFAKVAKDAGTRGAGSKTSHAIP